MDLMDPKKGTPSAYGWIRMNQGVPVLAVSKKHPNRVLLGFMDPSIRPLGSEIMLLSLIEFLFFSRQGVGVQRF